MAKDSIDRIVDKIETQIIDLDDLMPNPHTRHQYIKTIVLLYNQYIHEEQMFYAKRERLHTS